MNEYHIYQTTKRLELPSFSYGYWNLYEGQRHNSENNVSKKTAAKSFPSQKLQLLI